LPPSTKPDQLHIKHFYPIRQELLTFSILNEVVAAVAKIIYNCRQLQVAWVINQESFDSDKVLVRLLDVRGI